MFVLQRGYYVIFSFQYTSLLHNEANCCLKKLVDFYALLTQSTYVDLNYSFVKVDLNRL